MHKITTTTLHAIGPQALLSSSLGFVFVSRLFYIHDEVWQSRISHIDVVLTILTRNDVSTDNSCYDVGWTLEEIRYQHLQKLLGCFTLPLYLITLFQTPSTVRIQIPLLPQVSFWLMKLYLQAKRRKQNNKRNFLNGRLIQRIAGVMNHHHQ